ncbi:MAG TPA: leucyl aminopeptidase [Pseudonocardiaceae bacterium]|nr:leucyl aminopeptidase [Pseudonocardiaceae bacterium]
MTSPKLALTDADPATAAADAVIVGTVQTPQGVALAPGADAVDAAFGGGLLELLKLLGATGRADEVIKVPTGGTLTAPIVVATGLGRMREEVCAELTRRASGAAARSLTGVRRAVSTLSTLDVTAAAEGAALGAYQFTEYKSDNGDRPLGRVELVVPSAKDGPTRAELKRAVSVAQAVAMARDLVNTPPNDLYPASFAERAAKAGAEAGLTVEVLDEKALRKAGYGGVLGVGGGSARPPRVVRMRHSPAKARARVGLTGKGVTFDTGGISIKPAKDLHEMTCDMAGAAAVVATMTLVARLKLPVEVIATVPMVENMPSGAAYRPGDVLTMYGGKTVEVLNTDAEGRLILADALARACEDEPDYLLDVATLTGASVVALGTRTMGVMGTAQLRERVVERGRECGESAWPMPLPDELRPDLDSRLADIANVAGHRWAGMLLAGLFLRDFVADGVPWAHLDIAGPAWNGGSPYGYTTKGGTGAPVRTLGALLADIAESG